VRLGSTMVRRRAAAGLANALAHGLEVVRDLDVVVAIATRSDPTSFAEWQSARRAARRQARGTARLIRRAGQSSGRRATRDARG
jgi:hypothetical protein